jgi:hypothetical protein
MLKCLDAGTQPGVIGLALDAVTLGIEVGKPFAQEILIQTRRGLGNQLNTTLSNQENFDPPTTTVYHTCGFRTSAAGLPKPNPEICTSNSTAQTLGARWSLRSLTRAPRLADILK